MLCIIFDVDGEGGGVGVSGELFSNKHISGFLEICFLSNTSFLLGQLINAFLQLFNWPLPDQSTGRFRLTIEHTVAHLDHFE